MPIQPKLILIDGSSYFYRAFHALPPLNNSKGEPTGAIFGVMNMIRRLLKDYQPEYVAVVFDSKGKTFRDELYPAYKATREAMPDELSGQFNPLVDLISAMGIPMIMREGIEADDMIGTLVQKGGAERWEILISTGDKDMAQLVNDHVTLINTMTQVILDQEGVQKKFGVAPHQIIDYLTLMGDKVDNIPGVDGVGPKTAAKWLSQYGTLDAIIQHADEIKGKVGENLRQALRYLDLSKQLVTIKQDMDLPISLGCLRPEAPNKPKLIELLQKLEFRQWLDELLKESPKAKEHYQCILTLPHLKKWCEALQASEVFAFDTETTDLSIQDARLVGVSFALSKEEAAYLPFLHDYADAPLQLSRDTVFQYLKPILENPKIKKICQNSKYDFCVLQNEGITLQGCDYDTMLESYVLNSSSTRHDLDSLSLKYLGHRTLSFEDVAGRGVHQKNI